MSRSWADQIEAEDQDQDEGQGHEDQDPGEVEGEVRPTAEVPTTRSSTRMPARAASRTVRLVPASARQKAALRSPEGCSRAQQEEAREWS
jgi:hypothetical protein